MSRTDVSLRRSGFATRALPVGAALAVDGVCDVFESAWRAGNRSSIEDAVANLTGDSRSAAIRELIELDIFYRRKSGDHPSPKDYSARFPEVDSSWLIRITGESVLPEDNFSETADLAGRDEHVGAILGGKYKLIEEIGEGGMGSVFMAQQTEPVKRAVAVKVIKAGMDSKAVLARFEAERQALAMMDHPNIAKVLDAGTTESGRPFFVMELVKGMPITQYCDERKLTPRQRLELFVPVCQAIQHAHHKGIIHRDIKPSNVLVAMYDDKPVPKVIDFGVAKAAGSRLTDKTLMTGFGAVIGTPEYMSPEQANLNNLDIDTRSDVYSLGVLLYELLTGRTPMDRKSLGKAALLEILRIVREVEAPRPSAKLSTINTLPSVAANRGMDPAKLSKLMKGELDWVLLKALEKDRTRRYDTANGLAREIQRYLANEVVEARPPSARYRVSKFVRRHKGQVIAASLVLLTLVAGIAGTTFGLFEAKRQAREADRGRTEAIQAREDAIEQEKIAQKEQQRAEREAQAAQAVRTFLGDDLLQQSSTLHQAEARLLGGGQFKVKTNPTVRELLERAAEKLAPEKLESRFPGMPLVQAEVLATVGASYLGVSDFKKSLDYLERAVAIYRTNQAFDSHAALYARERHAMVIGLTDENRAVAIFEDLLIDMKRVLGFNHRNTFKLRLNLAITYMLMNKPIISESYCQGIVNDAKDQFGDANFMTMHARFVLAYFYLMKGKQEKAIKEMESIRFLAKKASIPLDHPDLMLGLVLLASAYANENRTKESIEVREEVLAYWEANGLGADPETRQTRHLLGWDYMRLNRFEDARKTFQKNMMSSLPPYDVMTSEAIYSSLMELGRYEDALTEIQKSLELFYKRAGKDRRTYEWGRIQARIGHALAELKRYEEAEKHLLDGYQQMLKSKQYQPTYDTQIIPNARTRLYEVYLALNRKDDANRWAEEQIIPELKKEAAERSFLAGGDTPESLKATVKLALFYKSTGRITDAVTLVEAALARGKDKGWPLNRKSLFSIKYKSNGWPLAADVLTDLDAIESVAQSSGRTDLAVAIASDVLGQLSKEKEVPKYLLALSEYSVGHNLALQNQTGIAERHLREALRLQVEYDPNLPVFVRTRLRLGSVLLGLKRYAEAEPILYEAFVGMQSLAQVKPTPSWVSPQDAIDRLIELYSATNKPDELKKWQGERAKYREILPAPNSKEKN